jgi:hypothetical protein
VPADSGRAALPVVDPSRLARIHGRGGLEPAGPGLTVGSAAAWLARDAAVLAVGHDGILRLGAEQGTSHGGSEKESDYPSHGTSVRAERHPSSDDSSGLIVMRVVPSAGADRDEPSRGNGHPLCASRARCRSRTSGGGACRHGGGGALGRSIPNAYGKPGGQELVGDRVAHATRPEDGDDRRHTPTQPRRCVQSNRARDRPIVSGADPRTEPCGGATGGNWAAAGAARCRPGAWIRRGW